MYTKLFQVPGSWEMDAHGSTGISSAVPCRNGYKSMPSKRHWRASLHVIAAQPEEHKKTSGETDPDADEIADWKGLWRPSSIDEAGALLVRQLRLQDQCCNDQTGNRLKLHQQTLMSAPCAAT